MVVFVERLLDNAFLRGARGGRVEGRDERLEVPVLRSNTGLVLKRIKGQVNDQEELAKQVLS